VQGPQDDGAGKRRDRAAGGADALGAGLSFADVAGQERAKQEVRRAGGGAPLEIPALNTSPCRLPLPWQVMEVCDMLRDPSRYQRVGARLPAGVLLVGPPGTGKTLLARVAAAEAGVPFYACSASDFVEVFVGRGPARVRKLFKQVRHPPACLPACLPVLLKCGRGRCLIAAGRHVPLPPQAAENAPCIVFIDELDSVGRSRRMGSMNSEQENTLNQILTSMDGLDTSNNGVVVMSATNRFELLDPALLRAGRFDRIVQVRLSRGLTPHFVSAAPSFTHCSSGQCPLPDRDGRLAILGVHARRFTLAPDVDLDRIAKVRVLKFPSPAIPPRRSSPSPLLSFFSVQLTPGTCGADLGAICNEAAIRTARRGGTDVSSDDFDDALRR